MLLLYLGTLIWVNIQCFKHFTFGQDPAGHWDKYSAQYVMKYERLKAKLTPKQHQVVAQYGLCLLPSSPHLGPGPLIFMFVALSDTDRNNFRQEGFVWAQG